jgi:hypothetical protein
MVACTPQGPSQTDSDEDYLQLAVKDGDNLLKDSGEPKLSRLSTINLLSYINLPLAYHQLISTTLHCLSYHSIPSIVPESFGSVSISHIHPCITMEERKRTLSERTELGAQPTTAE